MKIAESPATAVPSAVVTTPGSANTSQKAAAVKLSAAEHSSVLRLSSLRTAPSQDRRANIPQHGSTLVAVPARKTRPGKRGSNIGHFGAGAYGARPCANSILSRRSPRSNPHFYLQQAPSLVGIGGTVAAPSRASNWSDGYRGGTVRVVDGAVWVPISDF